MTDVLRSLSDIRTLPLPADEIRKYVASSDINVHIAIASNPLTSLSLAWPEVWQAFKYAGRLDRRDRSDIRILEALALRQSLKHQEQMHLLMESQTVRIALAQNTSLHPEIAKHLARGNRTPSTEVGDTPERHDEIRRLVAVNPRLPLALADELAAHPDYLTRRAIWKNLLIRGVGDADGTPRGALYEEFAEAAEPRRYFTPDDGRPR